MTHRFRYYVVTLLVATLTGVSPAAASDSQSDQTADTYEIIRVSVKTPQDLARLKNAGGQILNCVHHVGPMDVLVTPAQLERVRALDLPTTVVKRDVSLKPERRAGTVAGGDPFDDFYLDYREYGDENTPGTILWYMHELAARYPGLVSVISIGTTLEGRTIWGIRLNNDATGTDKPGVVSFGAEHSREWIATHINNFFANHLLENYGSDPIITDILDNVELILIPVFNVDGYLYTWSTNRYWRKNRRYNGLVNGSPSYGVDLNRNWGEGWGLPGASSDPNSEVYRGPSAFSEPETQVLRDFFLAHPNVQAQFDIHSYTQLILWPYGYTSTLPPDQAYYDQVGSAMQSLINGVHGMDFAMGPVNTAIYPVSGGSVDWTYAQLDLLSYSFEMRPLTSGQGGFELPVDQIIPACEELVPAMIHVLRSDWVRSRMYYVFADGMPDEVNPGQPTAIEHAIVGRQAAVDESTARLHYRFDPAAPFTEVSAQWLGQDQFRADLPATNCLAAPEFYFTVQDVDGTTLVHPSGAPALGTYEADPVGEADTFYSESLDTDPAWSASGDWAFGQPTGGGGQYGSPDPTSGHTGNNVYGYNLSGDYQPNLSETNLTTTAIDCTGRTGVHLSFWRWLGVETPAYDHAYVRVSNDGTTWTTVWSNQTDVTDSSWVLQDIDISSVADDEPTVYVRWTMGATDGAWQYCGWNVDDVSLYATACDPTYGDINGDTEVTQVDYDGFVACHTAPGEPLGPGCAIFDFNGNASVDCDDWAQFQLAWTGDGDAPALAACAAAAPAPQVTAEGSRYLSMTCEPGHGSVTLSVTSPDYPCLSVYANTGGALVASPPASVSDDWQGVLVTGAEIVPETTYRVVADYGSGSVADPVDVTTGRWADVVDPVGVVDFKDISAVVKCFLSDPQAPPAAWCDVHPEVPDQTVDFNDIAGAVTSFLTGTYPYATPECP